EWLAELAETTGADFCLPMTEAELSVLAAAGVSAFGATRILWAGPRAVKIGCDKLGTADFLREIGVPGPWTLAAEGDVIPPSLPCMFKPRRGSGSKAVFVCKTMEDVRFFQHRYPDGILQELLA